MRTSCLVEYNYNCQEPLAMFMLNVYYVTLLLKNQGTGCDSAAISGNVARHVHVKKCACSYSKKSKLS